MLTKKYEICITDNINSNGWVEFFAGVGAGAAVIGGTACFFSTLVC